MNKHYHYHLRGVQSQFGLQYRNYIWNMVLIGNGQENFNSEAKSFGVTGFQTISENSATVVYIALIFSLRVEIRLCRRLPKVQHFTLVLSLCVDALQFKVRHPEAQEIMSGFQKH